MQIEVLVTELLSLSLQLVKDKPLVVTFDSSVSGQPRIVQSMIFQPTHEFMDVTFPRASDGGIFIDSLPPASYFSSSAPFLPLSLADVNSPTDRVLDGRDEFASPCSFPTYISNLLYYS